MTRGTWGLAVLVVIGLLVVSRWLGRPGTTTLARLQVQIDSDKTRQAGGRSEIVAEKRVVESADRRGVVAQAQQLRARSQVKILAGDTLRVLSDSGNSAREVSVPPEVVTLIRADSALIAVQSVQLSTRDTVIARQDSALALDLHLQVLQDSAVVVAQRAGRGRLIATTAIVTTTVVALLVHLLR